MAHTAKSSKASGKVELSKACDTSASTMQEVSERLLYGAERLEEQARALEYILLGEPSPAKPESAMDCGPQSIAENMRSASNSLTEVEARLSKLISRIRANC